MFPGGHIGFVEDADGFATRLRVVLGGSGSDGSAALT